MSRHASVVQAIAELQHLLFNPALLGRREERGAFNSDLRTVYTVTTQVGCLSITKGCFVATSKPYVTVDRECGIS